jgi:hypothetical protein
MEERHNQLNASGTHTSATRIPPFLTEEIHGFDSFEGEYQLEQCCIIDASIVRNRSFAKL